MLLMMALCSKVPPLIAKTSPPTYSLRASGLARPPASQSSNLGCGFGCSDMGALRLLWHDCRLFATVRVD